MGSETGAVTSKAAEEEDEVEKLLVAAVVAHAQSRGVTVVPAVKASGKGFDSIICSALLL